MHEQAGAGVHFNNSATLTRQRFRNIFGDQIDTGYIQADNTSRQSHHVSDIWVNFIGHINGDVAVALNQYIMTSSGYRLGVEPLTFQLQAHGRVDTHKVQRIFFSGATAGAAVDLGFDQLLNGRLAIAFNEGKVATGRSHHLAAYNEQTMFITGDEALNNDAAAFIDGNGKGGADFLFCHQIGKYAAAMVAVGGFYHHRQADIFGGFPGVIGRFNDHAFGYRHPTGLEQALGQVFVARDGFGNGAGLVGFGRPDAALFGTIAQLYQIVFGQAHGRNLPIHRGVDDAARARAEQSVFCQILEFFNRSGHIEGLVFNGRHNQIATRGQRQASHFVMQVVHDYFVNTATICLTGTTKTAGYTRQAEQLQGHMLHDVGGPGALMQAFDETAIFFVAAAVLHQAWQPGNQSLGQAGDLVGWKVFQIANVHPGFQNRYVGPHIGTANRLDVDDFYGFMTHLGYRSVKVPSGKTRFG